MRVTVTWARIQPLVTTMSDNEFTGVWFCRGKHILCICYSLYDVCSLIERDVACPSETLLLLAYAVASLRPKSHACPETGFSGALTAYIGHKMPCLVLSTISISLRNIVRKWTWNEWDFRPPVCTYRPNWARITSWGWWDEWDDTALQILQWMGNYFFCFFLTPETGERTGERTRYRREVEVNRALGHLCAHIG